MFSYCNGYSYAYGMMTKEIMDGLLELFRQPDGIQIINIGQKKHV